MSFVIIDNTALSYTPSAVWGSISGTSWYGGKSIWAHAANESTGTYGTVSYTFEGTYISFIGNTPGSTLEQTFSVSIDSGDAFNATYPVAAEYLAWYTTPTLDSGSHTIEIANLDRTDVDYVLVGLAQDTALNSRDLVVDSSSTDITYRGDWSESDSTLGHVTTTYILNTPLGNSTQVTTTEGASMEFSFYGTSVTVYGIQQQTVTGSVEALFSVDGSDASTYTYTVSTKGNDLPNTALYTISGLSSSSQHTLTMNVTSISTLKFQVDYITYVPSFDTLANMPQAGASASSSTTSSTSSAAAASATESNGSTIGAASSSSSSGGSSNNTGAIAGGVVGGIALLAAIAALLFWLRRRNQKRAQREQGFPIIKSDSSEAHSVEPFTDSPPMSSVYTSFPMSPVSQASPMITPPMTRNEKNLVWLHPGSHEGSAASLLSPSSPSSQPGASSSTFVERQQAEIKKRLDEINHLMALKENQPPVSAGGSPAEAEQVEELQRRIDALTEENARLMAVPPPAYGA